MANIIMKNESEEAAAGKRRRAASTDFTLEAAAVVGGATVEEMVAKINQERITKGDAPLPPVPGDELGDDFLEE